MALPAYPLELFTFILTKYPSSFIFIFILFIYYLELFFFLSTLYLGIQLLQRNMVITSSSPPIIKLEEAGPRYNGVTRFGRKIVTWFRDTAINGRIVRNVRKMII